MQGSVIVESVLSRAVSDADLVIEAVVEDVEIKNSLFRGARLLLLIMIIIMMIISSRAPAH